MRYPIVIVLVLCCVACSSTRKRMERAAVYEREGMLQEAYNGYADIHDRRPRTVEAHVGMKRTAQGLFDRLQADASSLYMVHDLGGGERKRSEALDFKARMDAQGLELQWDPMLEQHRTEARQVEADRLYQGADAAYRAGRFEEAEQMANASFELDRTRKETEYLLKLAQLEPRFREGQRAMDLGLWRDAYQRFKWVTDRDVGYKEAQVFRDSCREKASYTLCYVPIYNATLYANEFSMAMNGGTVEAQLAASVKSALLDLNDPFLVLVDRDNTDAILAEQHRQMSGVFDERYTMETGRLLGARFVLTAKLLRFDDVLFKQCEVQMQLIETSTGRIHASEIVRVSKQEIEKGAPRTQLLAMAAKRIALRVSSFDPIKR